MLQKSPKPWFRRQIKTGAKVFFVIEAVAFFVSYGAWYKLNTDRDFRLTVHRNYPSVLENYYRIGEYLSGDNNSRTLDFSIWQQEGKLN